MDTIDLNMPNENCNDLIMSTDVLDLFLPVEYNLSRVLLDVSRSCVKTLNEKYNIVYTHPSNLLSPEFIEYYYRAVPKCYGLLDTYNIDVMGVTRLRRLPNYNLYGYGVMIGFVDTGINYANPLFINRDRSTRIHSIWDQTINIEGEISYMGYGREYSREDINNALRSEVPIEALPSVDELNHGTFLAAAAAGNTDQVNDFSGVSVSSDIVMVKLKPAKRTIRSYFLINESIPCYQENDIVLGIKYLLDVAREMGKPMVICIGLGTNSGGHDGNNILSEYLNDIANRLGVCVILAGGNEASSRCHYVETTRNPDENYKNVEIRVGEGEEDFSVELWASMPQIYSVEMISPGGEYFRPRQTRVNSRDYADFIFERTIVHINTFIMEPGSGDHLIFMRFLNPAPGIWTIRVVDEDPYNTSFNIWLPIRPFLASDTYFLLSNPTTTITEPGNARIPITIAAYNHITNSIYINSSRGYTRTGRIKPDIAAPGVNIYGPSEYGGFTRKSGTSVAAAQAAGVAALLMEWGIVLGNRPLMNTTEIKGLLIRSAHRAEFNYPNREWGYGTLDIYGVFESLRQTIF